MKPRLSVFLGFVFSFLFLVSASSACGQRAAAQEFRAQKFATQFEAHPRERVLRADALEWRPEPSLPPGAKSVVLEGDPTRRGLVILRLKMPNGYRIPPVWHPANDRFTVISGTYHMGVGAKFDESKTVALRAGDFAWLSAAAPHYGWCEREAVLEVVGLGPFVTNYVNRDEDPRKR